jgi:very-short-patch-repair endonuclease
MRGKQDHTRERSLRRNQTEAERTLWQHLRNGRLLNYKFRRQHRIGPYYVDFYCAEAMLIIELDGSQHLQRSNYDEHRTLFLEVHGYRVQRFWNDEALVNLNLVLDAIAILLNAPHPPCGHPLPASGARDVIGG